VGIRRCGTNESVSISYSELSRRGYVVGFTIGNTPGVDLLCTAPDGKAFKVQVKGISNKAGFYVQEEFFTTKAQADLFLIMAFVPKIGDDAPCEYFVLSHADAIRENKKMRGTDYGLNWGSLAPYRDEWSKLP
jgi:hypothetical protein